ncbi:MAG: DUF99 family protein [Methanomicrobiales archaeon]|nr:DUF99 family protein [Methanomicrobiales archaeon]
MHIAKGGLRALGIAESFSGRTRSLLAGVVMRKDLRVDGVAFAPITVGGTDATEGVLRLYRSLHRRDVNCLLISGCVIAWYNILDPARIARETDLPVLSITYEASEGLERDIIRHFPGDDQRLAAYRHLGERTAFLLHTGSTIYLRAWGIPFHEAALLCDQFTYDGKVPEPVRVARLTARAVVHCPEKEQSGIPASPGQAI